MHREEEASDSVREIVSSRQNLQTARNNRSERMNNESGFWIGSISMKARVLFAEGGSGKGVAAAARWI